MSSQKHYIVDHLEPEIGAWSTLEYVAISSEIATTPTSHFYLTSVAPDLANNLPAAIQALPDGQIKVTTDEITQLHDIKNDRVCLLDPQGKEELSPEDGDRFDWYVFGGILGG